MVRVRRAILTRALLDALSSVHVLAVRVVSHRVRVCAVDTQRRTVRHAVSVVDEPLTRLQPAQTNRRYLNIRIETDALPPSPGGSIAEWLACWTQAQKGPGSNRSSDAVG